MLVGMGGNTREVGGKWGGGVVWVGASRRWGVTMGRWGGCYVFKSVRDGTVVDGKGGGWVCYSVDFTMSLGFAEVFKIELLREH